MTLEQLKSRIEESAAEQPEEVEEKVKKGLISYYDTVHESSLSPTTRRNPKEGRTDPGGLGPGPGQGQEAIARKAAEAILCQRAHSGRLRNRRPPVLPRLDCGGHREYTSKTYGSGLVPATGPYVNRLPRLIRQEFRSQKNPAFKKLARCIDFADHLTVGSPVTKAPPNCLRNTPARSDMFYYMHLSSFARRSLMETYHPQCNFIGGQRTRSR